MRSRESPSPALVRLAAAQARVLSSEQIGGSGLSRHSVARLVDQGQWQRLARCLYLASSEPPTWLGLAWGGVLLGGVGAALGGRAAAHLWGLVPEPATIPVVVQHGSSRALPEPWRILHSRPGVRLPPVGEPARLTAEDTILDLCRESGEDEVVGIVTAAVQRRVTKPTWLRRRISERERVAHRRLLLDLLSGVAAGAESPLELRYLHDVERAHGLPVAHRQYRSTSGHVRDAYYREYATLVELDGRLGHEGMGRFRDMERDNWATANGLLTLRFGSRDVFARPCVVARQVARTLQRAGWTGELRRCRRCRHLG